MTAPDRGLAFLLVHSPLVGPTSWNATADELRSLGAAAAVPELKEPEAGEPYSQAHAASAAAGAGDLPATAPLVAAGHSGAGALLPLVGEAIGRRPVAYLFVDAGLPTHGRSRLEQMDAEEPRFAAELRGLFEEGRAFPEWTDEMLAPEIADSALRRAILTEVRPRGADYFEEAIPDVPGWPDAPCGYLRFSEPYVGAECRARESGWHADRLDGGHFLCATDPSAVAAAMLRLATRCLEEPLRATGPP